MRARPDLPTSRPNLGTTKMPLRLEWNAPTFVVRLAALLLYLPARLTARRLREKAPAYWCLHHYFSGNGHLLDLAHCPKHLLEDWVRLAASRTCYKERFEEVDMCGPWLLGVGSCHIYRSHDLFVMRDFYRFHQYCDWCDEDVAFCRCMKPSPTWRWVRVGDWAASVLKKIRLPLPGRQIEIEFTIEGVASGRVEVQVGKFSKGLHACATLLVSDQLVAHMPGKPFHTRLCLMNVDGEWRPVKKE